MQYSAKFSKQYTTSSAEIIYGDGKSYSQQMCQGIWALQPGEKVSQSINHMMLTQHISPKASDSVSGKNGFA